MANPMKVVDNVYIEMTDDEVAEAAALSDAADLNIGRVRSERNGLLSGSDWTQLGDCGLSDGDVGLWQTYRQSLRDIPQTYSRVSEVVWPTPPA